MSFCFAPSPGRKPTARGTVLFLGQFFDAAHEIEILLEVLSLKARGETPVIVLGEIFVQPSPCAETVNHSCLICEFL